MDRPCSLLALLPVLLCCIILSSVGSGSAEPVTAGTPDGSELWGYVEVRPSNAPISPLSKSSCTCCSERRLPYHCARVAVVAEAHLFWWYYKSPQRTSKRAKPWPTVLWLQGGPVHAATPLMLELPLLLFTGGLNLSWNRRLVGFAGRVGRRVRQLPGDRSAGRQPAAAQLHVAAEG
jgi:hypothetical protein